MIGVVAVLVSLVAVIVAVPTPTAVTVVVPFVELAGLTVKTAVLLDTQLTARPVRIALPASVVVAVSVCVPPTIIGVVSEESVTEDTGTGLTVIEGVVAAGAVSLVAVIVAVPVPIAVTVTVAPLEVLTELAALTVSTVGSLETQLTVRPESGLLLPSLGTAVSTWVPPISIGVVSDESVTVVTGAGLTVISDVPITPSLVAVIVTGPPATTAVTRPFPSTVATAVLFEVQATVRPVSTLPGASLVTTVSC
jgi:hypothetical protein